MHNGRPALRRRCAARRLRHRHHRWPAAPRHRHAIAATVRRLRLRKARFCSRRARLQPHTRRPRKCLAPRRLSCATHKSCWRRAPQTMRVPAQRRVGWCSWSAWSESPRCGQDARGRARGRRLRARGRRDPDARRPAGEGAADARARTATKGLATSRPTRCLMTTRTRWARPPTNASVGAGNGRRRRGPSGEVGKRTECGCRRRALRATRTARHRLL